MPPPNPENRELDALLAAARWPEADPQTVERLTGEWDALVERRQLQRKVLVSLSLAASLLVALGAWVTFELAPARQPQPNIVQRRQDESQRNDAAPQEEVQPNPDDSSAPSRKPDASTPQRVERPVVPATELAIAPTEAWMLLLTAAMEREAKTREKVAAPQPEEPAKERENSAGMVATEDTEKLLEAQLAQILQMIAVDEMHPRQAVLVARLSRRLHERTQQRIIEIINEHDPKNYQAAVRLLAHIGDVRALPTLEMAWEHVEYSQEVAAAFVRMQSFPRLMQLVAEQPIDLLRQELLGEILRVPEPAATWEILRRAQWPDWQRDLATVLRNADVGQVQGLMRLLEAPQAETRLAAMQALAMVDDPAVSRALINLLDQQSIRRAVLLTLAQRTDSEARAWQQQAGRDPRLAAELEAGHLYYVARYGPTFSLFTGG